MRNLNEGNEFTDEAANRFLFIKKKFLNTQGYFDPNESWKDFFHSMVEFRDPKIVPIKRLNGEFDPE